MTESNHLWKGWDMEALTPWHLLLIIIGFMLLFGYKKLPDATRSLGRSLRIFKTEMRAMGDDDPADHAPAASAQNTPRLPASESVAALEAEARVAESHAAELRARADAHHGLPDRPR